VDKRRGCPTSSPNRLTLTSYVKCAESRAAYDTVRFSRLTTIQWQIMARKVTNCTSCSTVIHCTASGHGVARLSDCYPHPDLLPPDTDLERLAAKVVVHEHMDKSVGSHAVPSQREPGFQPCLQAIREQVRPLVHLACCTRSPTQTSSTTTE